MQRLEEDRLKKLLDIIQHSPYLRIAHFNDSSHTLSKILYEFSIQNDYEYQLNCTNDSFYEESITRYKDKNVNIRKIDIDKPNYKIQARVYEYLFVTSSIADKDISGFLKKSYHLIKNAGNIIIIVPKEDNNIDKYTSLLEDNYYVATSSIDLFDGYDLIISKKMHGWGDI